MSRFSHRAVPVGYVPSAGSALTGSVSPSPAIIRAVTAWTKSGASAGTGGRRSASLVTVSGTVTSAEVLERGIHRVPVPLHHGLAAPHRTSSRWRA